MRDFDPHYVNGLKGLLKKPMSSTEELDFGEFSAPYYLLPNGSLRRVDDNNKHEYVRVAMLAKLFAGREAQLRAVLQGFESLPCVPPSLRELEGAPEETLRALAEGQRHLDSRMIIDKLQFRDFAKSSPTPAMFRSVLASLSQLQLRGFLRLVTAQNSAPAGGFSQVITVQCSGERAHLPVGHTCSLTLDLPDYSNEPLLRKKLLQALEHVDHSGFDYV